MRKEDVKDIKSLKKAIRLAFMIDRFMPNPLHTQRATILGYMESSITSTENVPDKVKKMFQPCDIDLWFEVMTVWLTKYVDEEEQRFINFKHEQKGLDARWTCITRNFFGDGISVDSARKRYERIMGKVFECVKKSNLPVR